MKLNLWWCQVFLLLMTQIFSTSNTTVLRCFQCNTTFHMGCWYGWKTPESGVEPKHLQPCQPVLNVSGDTGKVVFICLKETYYSPQLSNSGDDIHPFVKRSCGQFGAGAPNLLKFLPNYCIKKKRTILLSNQTNTIDSTLCSCSTDACNKSSQALTTTVKLIIYLISSSLLQIICYFSSHT